MTSDQSLFIKRIRHLSQALIISGALNIGVLSMLLYWMLKESPPTPYCELKPASFDQQQILLVDQRGCTEMLAQLSQLSFFQLVNRLSQTQLIENGYAERDLALACLIAFHHFDIQRALPKNAQPQQQRLLAWKPKNQNAAFTLIVYPDLTQQQFDSLAKFAKTERWPLTAEGLFLLLQEQKQKNEMNDDLVRTFALTPEFWTVELLFNRSRQQANRQEILTILLEGNWTILKQFFEQQRQIHDLSNARRQKFLLDYLKAGSSSSAILLLKMEWEFTIKKLDDQQVLTILQFMPTQLFESMQFAKEILVSPRSTHVWQQAAQWLYTQAGESMPKTWNHQAVLARFVPDKQSVELISKPLVPTSLLVSSLSVMEPQGTIDSSIKSSPPVKSLTHVSQPVLKVPVSLIKTQMIIDKKNLVSSSEKTQLYIVQEGDSLWKIARRFGVKIEEIKKLNELKSDKLKPQTTLKIPSNQ